MVDFEYRGAAQFISDAVSAVNRDLEFCRARPAGRPAGTGAEAPYGHPVPAGRLDPASASLGLTSVAHLPASKANGLPVGPQTEDRTDHRRGPLHVTERGGLASITTGRSQPSRCRAGILNHVDRMGRADAHHVHPCAGHSLPAGSGRPSAHPVSRSDAGSRAHGIAQPFALLLIATTCAGDAPAVHVGQNPGHT